MTAIGRIPTTAIDHHLAYRNAPAVSYFNLAEGVDGTLQTLGAMKDCVLGQAPPDYSGFEDEFNIRAARDICASAITPGHNAQRNIAALFNFCALSVEYREHPINQQVCQDARRTIELGSGDCVSLSVCLATLLACLGYSPYFIAQYPSDETGYSHVYVGLRLNGEELRLDPVASDKLMGWSQPLPDGGFETTWPIFGD